MSFLRFCKHLYLTHFSKPVSERVLFRALKKNEIYSIVELGVGDLSRSQRLLKFAIEMAESDAADGEEVRVSYTGIDMFEAREQGDGVPLKEAHKTLKRLCQTVKLVPGDPFSALARCANGLQNSDLIIVSADQDAEAMDRAWFYIPRMMNESTIVFLETRTAQARDENQDLEQIETSLELLSREDIDAMSLSQNSSTRRAA